MRKSGQWSLSTCLAILVHLVVAIPLIWQWEAWPKQSRQSAPVIVQASLVSEDPARVRADKAREAARQRLEAEREAQTRRKAAAEEAARQQAEAEAQAKREAEAKAAAEKEAQARREAEAKAAEEKRQAEAAARERELALKRKQQAEARARQEQARREAEAKAARERQEAEARAQRQREEAARKQAEAEKARKAREAAEREARLKAAEAQRRAEEAAERARIQAGKSALGDRLKAVIADQWSRPPGTTPQMEVEVALTLLPSGELLDAKISHSSGNAAFDRSAVQAAFAAAPFDEFLDYSVAVRNEARHITISFKAEDLAQ